MQVSLADIEPCESNGRRIDMLLYIIVMPCLTHMHTTLTNNQLISFHSAHLVVSFCSSLRIFSQVDSLGLVVVRKQPHVRLGGRRRR